MLGQGAALPLRVVVGDRAHAGVKCWERDFSKILSSFLQSVLFLVFLWILHILI